MNAKMILRSIFSNKTIDVLYLTDADKCLLVIKAWEGLKVS